MGIEDHTEHFKDAVERFHHKNESEPKHMRQMLLWEETNLERRANTSHNYNKCVSLIFAFSFIFLMVKFAMVMFACQTGLWNAQWPISQGCVPVEDVHSSQ